jgi:acetylcholinesterase
LEFHRGAFLEGSGTQQMFSPEYLLMQNVIVVSINYRLHALGFLMLPSMGIAGNAGLKDQQMALEWVYENIENFNGDRNRICLFGESAGGVSVHMQVLNEKSRKMISSAICQSGNALCDWAIQREGIECTRRLAVLLGCKNSSNDKDVYDTLMTAQLEKLFRNIARANSRDDRRRNLNMTFKPVIELNSKNAFMTKTPRELMIAQKDPIPMIFGCTNKEGIIQTSFMKKNFPSFNKDVAKLIPISLNVDPDGARAAEIGNEIKNFYFKGAAIGEGNEENFIDLMSDLHFITPQTMCNELIAKYHKSKQYLYEFRFDGELNILKKILQMDYCKGACHADELYYLFGYVYFQ